MERREKNKTLCTSNKYLRRLTKKQDWWTIISSLSTDAHQPLSLYYDIHFVTVSNIQVGAVFDPLQFVVQCLCCFTCALWVSDKGMPGLWKNVCILKFWYLLYWFCPTLQWFHLITPPQISWHFFVSCYYCFYSHGRAIKSRSGGVYMKMKDKDGEGGSLSEEDENKESAL